MRVVIDLLIGKGPRATLTKAEIVEAAKMDLKREISKYEYNKVKCNNFQKFPRPVLEMLRGATVPSQL